MESKPSLDISINMAQIHETLRRAGASPADLAWVEENVRNELPDEISSYADNLRQQAPDDLAKTINGIHADSRYGLGPDSQPQTGVPEGRVTESTLADSTTFPGFEHKWWLYIPAQYTNQAPIPLMVFLDGEWFMARSGHWRATLVLDNLIAHHELPVMAAIFVDSGQSIAKSHGKSAQSNRSIEYDTLSDAYALFLLHEILPLAREHIRITDDPSSRGIAGCSSGGIGSFTVAWQRPDQFRKVISFSGSFARLRGGEAYPDLVHREARKPIRVFQQVGANDLVFEGLPPWLEENNLMSRALDDKQYDHKYIVDQGTHCSVGAASILPDAMRWIWRDYPRGN